MLKSENIMPVQNRELNETQTSDNVCYFIHSDCMNMTDEYEWFRNHNMRQFYANMKYSYTEMSDVLR